jgi:hypothetical protein
MPRENLQSDSKKRAFEVAKEAMKAKVSLEDSTGENWYLRTVAKKTVNNPGLTSAGLWRYD